MIFYFIRFLFARFFRSHLRNKFHQFVSLPEKKFVLFVWKSAIVSLYSFKGISEKRESRQIIGRISNLCFCSDHSILFIFHRIYWVYHMHKHTHKHTDHIIEWKVHRFRQSNRMALTGFSNLLLLLLVQWYHDIVSVALSAITRVWPRANKNKTSAIPFDWTNIIKVFAMLSDIQCRYIQT